MYQKVPTPPDCAYLSKYPGHLPLGPRQDVHNQTQGERQCKASKMVGR